MLEAFLGITLATVIAYLAFGVALGVWRTFRQALKDGSISIIGIVAMMLFCYLLRWL
jgi:hypothetical protein